MTLLRTIFFLWTVWACASGGLVALEFSPQPITGGTFRFKDCSGQVFSPDYIQNYSYAHAAVTVTLDAPGNKYLSGLIQATGLKPNYAYQIKLAGRNSKLNPGGGGDDATNERLGLIGRWWRAYPNPANAKDDDYFLHRDDPNYAYSAYLIIGFFITDEQGNATTRFEGDSSYHVLWRTNQRPPFVNDGPVNTFTLPATDGNAAYNVSKPALQLGVYGEWEPTRALPGTLEMPDGHYACDFVLTEESFHDFGPNAGNWTAALGSAIEFDIGIPSEIQWSSPADITYPAPLTSLQLNATAPEPGHFSYDPPLGTVLNAGKQTLSVTFTPDATGIALPIVRVNLNVRKGSTTVMWNPPSNIRANTPLDPSILSATATVPGYYVYEPPLGRILPAGPATLTLQFVPNDFANYLTPPFITHDIEVISGLLIISGPWANPIPAYAGLPVQFNAATGARGIVWNWDFGDGDMTGHDSVTTHTYALPGTYTATVTAHVPNGRSETQSLSVEILPLPANSSLFNGDADDDGDGFCNALELAWGSDPTLLASTPLNGLSAANPAPMQSTKFSVLLPASLEGAHPRCSLPTAKCIAPGGPFRIDLRLVVTVPASFNPAASRVGIATAGHAFAVDLDANGRANVGGATIFARPLAGGKSSRSYSINATLDGSYLILPDAWAGPYNDGSVRDQTVMLVFAGNVYSVKVKTKLKSVRGSVMIGAVK